jgi:biopolymer transport protein ExbD
MFMLILSTLAMTAWTQLAMLNVQAPQIGSSDNPGNGAVNPATATALNLTVFILKDGYNIAASGATLDGNSEGRPGQPLIPKITVTEPGKPATSAYDYVALQKRLIEVKKSLACDTCSFPGEASMIISADGDVSYDAVVQTMDAARKSSDGKILFPGVAFAAGVVG